MGFKSFVLFLVKFVWRKMICCDFLVSGNGNNWYIVFWVLIL